MSSPEIIMNLWYVIDDEGLIYSLRARCYVHSGTDEEKLAFLKGCAETDYLIAQPFPVPEGFHVRLVGDDKEQQIPVASYSAVRATVPFISLFEDAIQAMQRQLPAQTKLYIGSDPVVCVTPLLGDENGNMRPLTANIERV
jgi:hypothetical protein